MADLAVRPFPPEEGLLRMIHHYANKGRNWFVGREWSSLIMSILGR